MQAIVPLVFKFNEKTFFVDLMCDVFMPRISALRDKIIADCQGKHPKETLSDEYFDLMNKLKSIQNVWNLVKGEPIVPSLSVHDNADIQYEKPVDLYDLCDQFIQQSMMASSSPENIELIEEFSKILLEMDDLGACPDTNLEEKHLIQSLQNQIIEKYGKGPILEGFGTLLSCTSALLLPTGKLQSNVPLQTFEILRQCLESSEIKIAHKSESCHIGNVAKFHKNASNFIANKPMNNIHEAVSKLLFGTPEHAEIFQLACYQMVRDYPEIAEECLHWTNCNSNSKGAIVNSLLNVTLPNQFTVAILARVIKRNVVIHIGTHNQEEGSTKQVSYKFGNYPERSPVEVMILDHKLYPLVPVEGISSKSNSIPVVDAQACKPSQNTWTFQDPTLMEFGDFSEKTSCFFKNCSFCQEFGIDECTHISPEHKEAFMEISKLLEDNKYGLFEASEIPICDIQTDTILPENISSNFNVVSIKRDGQCLFSSCAYALTKSVELAIPLRRCTQIEYYLNRSLYEQFYIKGNIPLNEIEQNNKILHSVTEWGNSFSIALLSRFLNRKIVVFEPNDTHVTYDITSHPSDNFRPIFLFLSGNHFQPLIPKMYTSNLVPKGKDNQYQVIHDLVNNSDNNEGLTVSSIQNSINCENIESGHCITSSIDVSVRPSTSSSKIIFVWDRPIAESEIMQLKSLIAEPAPVSKEALLPINLNGEPSHVAIEPNDSNILLKLNINSRAKIEQSKMNDFVLYTNCIMDDIRAISTTNHQEDFIRVFVQRCSFDTFWTTNVARVKGEAYRKKNAKDVKSFGKKLMTNLQTTDLAREITMELLARANFSQKSIVLYSNLTKERINQFLVGKSRKGKLKDEVNAIFQRKCAHAMKREYPGYNFDGLVITKKLETHMKSRMKPVDASNLEFRINNLRLPDNVGQELIKNVIPAQQEHPMEVGLHCSSSGSQKTAEIVGDSSMRVNKENVDVITLQECSPAQPIEMNESNESNDEDFNKFRPICDESVTDEDTLDSDIEENEDSDDEDLKTKQEYVKEIFSDDVLNYVPPNTFLMEISATEMAEIFDYASLKFRKGKWAGSISNHITKNQGACSFKTRHSPDYYTKQSSGFSIMNGYCGCKLKFKVKLMSVPEKDKPATFEVTSEGTFRLIQSKYCGRKLIGEERRKVGEELIHNMPSKVLCEHISTESPLHLLHNTTKLHSLEMLQQLRHETLKAGSICLDPMSDLLAFKKETEMLENGSNVKGFIHLIKESQGDMQIHMYNEMSLRLLQSSQRAGQSVLYVDASGSLTFPVNNKQMLFYLAFLETSKGHISPVASSLAHRGRAIDIADLFVKVKGDMKQIKNNNKPLAGVIVTDFSFAMLSGVLQGANVQELRDYLQHASNVIMEKSSFDPLRSVVFICSSHLIHSFSRLLRKHVPSSREYKEIRQLAMHSIARLQACTDFSEYKNTVSCIIETFGNEFVNEDKISHNIAYLTGNLEISDNEEQVDNSSDDIVDFNDHDLLREKSPFYQEFLKIKSCTTAQQDISESKNSFYLPIVVELFEKYYCPYFPLYSAAILEKSGRYHKGSLTNGMIETEFNQIKNYFHQKQKVPFNIFIRKHYIYFTGRVRQIFLPDSNRKRRIHQRLIRGEKRYDVRDPEERWSKKRRNSKNCYIKRNVFKLNALGNTPLNSTHTTTKHQACTLIQQQAVTGKVQYYSPCPADLTTKNRYRATAANSTEKYTYNNADAHSSIGTDRIKLTSSTDKPGIADNDNNSPAEPKQSEPVQDVVPLDELARFPYRALKIQGQKFDEDTVIFRSKQLAELCNPREWIDFDVMDRLLQYAHTKNVNSKYAVSEVHFAWKQNIDSAQPGNDWQSIFHFDKITNNDSRCVDPRKSNYILHPLFMVNHYCLLEISKIDRKCTVYDSMNRNLDQLQEIANNVLPLFLLPNESIHWNIQYANDYPLQYDSSSCGLYTYEACKLLIQDQIPSTKLLQHVRNARQCRVQLVRELLQTTNEGKRILHSVQNDDCRLERTLMIVHNLREELKQKIEAQIKKLADQKKVAEADEKKRERGKENVDAENEEAEESTGAEKSGKNVMERIEVETEYKGALEKGGELRQEGSDLVEKSEEKNSSDKLTVGVSNEQVISFVGKLNTSETEKKSDDITKKPFEEIYNDPANLPAGIKMLAKSVTGKTDKSKNSKGKRNIKELLRRLGGGKKKAHSDGLELIDDQPMNMKHKLIPHYEEKQELFNKHCMQIKRIGLLEIRNLCEEIVPELQDLKDGRIKSQRDIVFRSSSNTNKSLLNRLAAVRAFSDSQDFQVGMYLDDVFNKGDDHLYVNYVLKPEALIRIYARKCNLPIEFAEKELLFGPDYDGHLPPKNDTPEN